LSLNDRAAAVCERIAADAAGLGVEVLTIAGARVIDAGVNQRGSLAAGVELARTCMADLGSVVLTSGTIATAPLPVVTVTVNHPVSACLASQYAGWQVAVEDYYAIGSGPMRSARGKEKLFDDIGFRERPTLAVGVLEAGKLPPPRVIEHLASELQLPPHRLTLLVARTASMAGGVQVVARSVETAMHKLHELKFDLKRVVGGIGSTPLPPVAGDDLDAIGRTNDAILYGSRVVLYVTGDDETLVEAGRQLPASTSRDYGSTFGELFARYNHDFYRIDPMLFSPARVCLQNLDTGKVHLFGELDEALLAKSFGLS
jgi:methenyltetrahydromethanopterin cyclohydrolase